MRNLQVSFNNLDNNQPITISLAGRLTAMNAINFKNDLLNILVENSKDCYIDISELIAMDATGVNALVMAHKNISTTGSKMYIISTDENPANEFLHLTKFNSYLNMVRA